MCLNTPGNEGFAFSPAINLIGGNASTNVSFAFDVTGINGALISDLSILFNGAVSGTGSASFSETHGAGVCTPDCTVLQVTNPPPNFSKQVVFNTPVLSMHIVKDVIAVTGSNGQVSVAQVENRFSNLPEPLTGLIAGSGLLGLGFLRKSRLVK